MKRIIQSVIDTKSFYTSAGSLKQLHFAELRFFFSRLGCRPLVEEIVFCRAG